MTGERVLPNLGLTNRWTAGSDGWGGGMDADFAMLDALLFLSVKSATLAAPPTSPAEGDRYIVPAGATGAWAAQDTKIAVRVDSAWTFYTPRVGWKAYVVDADKDFRFKAGAWSAIASEATSGTGTGTGTDTGTGTGTGSDGTGASNPPATPAAGAHRFWRINIRTNTSGSYPTISEVVLASAAGGPSLTTGGTAIASSEYSAGGEFFPAVNACDGNPNTCWGSANGGSLPAWWGYDLGAGHAALVREVRLTARPEGGIATNQAPGDWDLQWSEDGVNWTTKQSYTSAAWTAGGTQAFAVTAS